MHARPMNALITATLLCSMTGIAAAEDLPNLVIIVTADQGIDAIEWPPNTALMQVHTPNLNAMAKQGVSFTNCRMNPNCSPTRAAWINGLREEVRLIREVDLSTVPIEEPVPIVRNRKDVIRAGSENTIRSPTDAGRLCLKAEIYGFAAFLPVCARNGREAADSTNQNRKKFGAPHCDLDS